MKQLSYWKKFAKSGNVLDYLYYKQSERQKKYSQFQKEEQKNDIGM